MARNTQPAREIWYAELSNCWEQERQGREAVVKLETMSKREPTRGSIGVDKLQIGYNPWKNVQSVGSGTAQRTLVAGRKQRSWVLR